MFPCAEWLGCNKKGSSVAAFVEYDIKKLLIALIVDKQFFGCLLIIKELYFCYK